MAFLAQKLIYIINIWFSFVFGWFFEQLNFFISGVYAKRWPKCARISHTKTDVAQNLIDFFPNLTLRGPFHRRILSEKKYGGMGLISEKTEVLYTELNERAEAATGSYSGTGDSLQHIYSVPASKNHWKKKLKKNSLWLLPFYMVWLLISIMKRWAERCALQLYQTSLNWKI